MIELKLSTFKQRTYMTIELLPQLNGKQPSVEIEQLKADYKYMSCSYNQNK
jgi:hypothetical protein